MSPVAVPLNPRRLLDAADRSLATRGAGRPNAMTLRRAVSTAYYAVFHDLCRRTAEHVLPNGHARAQLALARTIRHGELKTCCGWIAQNVAKPGDSLDALVDALRQCAPLVNAAGVFYELQEKRHAADYDHFASFDKRAALATVREAEGVIDVIDGLSPADRDAFLGLLALYCVPHGSARA